MATPARLTRTEVEQCRDDASQESGLPFHDLTERSTTVNDLVRQDVATLVGPHADPPANVTD
ncbi:MAG: hypothetical protein ACYCXA_07240 [Actinomycetes bacterium]